MRGYVKTLLFASIALVACNQPAISKPTAPEGLVGLLEVKVTGLNSTPSAQTRWVRSAGVSRQSIGLVGELPTVLTRVVQVVDADLNHLQQTQPTRYVSAMLDLTNNSSTAFSNLVLYPINDPQRSIGGTALSALTASNGSPISDVGLARAFIPSHGMYNFGWNVMVQPSHAHLLLLTPSEVEEVRGQLDKVGIAAEAQPLQYAFRAANSAGDWGRPVGAVGSGTNRAFAAVSYSFPRTTDRTQAPDGFTLLFAVGNDTLNTLGQSLEEQPRNTVAGLEYANATVSGVAEVRTLSPTGYTAPNHRPLCRIVTAGSLSNPSATLGNGEIGCVLSPVGPTGFSSSNLAATEVNLSWNAVVTADSYTLERGLGANPSSWTALALSSPTATRFSDTGLLPATGYNYRLRANNKAGNSPWASLSLITQAAQAPGIPQNFSATALSPTSVRLSWQAPIASAGATSYTLERGLGQNPSSWTGIPLPPPLMSTAYTDSGLQAATGYSYRLRANNPAGTSDWVVTSVQTPAVATVSFTAEDWLGGIGDIPWSLNFTPDQTRLLFTPRNQSTLQLRSVDLQSREVSSIISDPPIAVRVGTGDYNEGGIMGMELDPDFASNNRVYICYSYWKDGVQTPDNRFVRVSRLEVSGSRLNNEQVLVNEINGTDIHKGCRVVINGGKVYISTGDAQNTSGSQSLESLSGKILRVNLDGSMPADNPDWDNNPATQSSIWTLGHRNPQGLGFQPGTALLWSTEHGPYTRDEINIIRPGRNYGWPNCLGIQGFGTTLVAPEWGATQTHNCVSGASPTLNEGNYQPAVVELEPSRAIAISDLVFYPAGAQAFSNWQGNMLFVSLRASRLYRAEISGERITKQEVLLDYGENNRRMRDIAVGPDGLIYISTDGGSIFRLVPKAVQN